MATVVPYSTSSSANARAVLSLMLVAAVCLVVDAVVGLRGINVGTDTHAYAGFFLSMREGLVATRFEPGFVLVTRALSATGMSVTAYQACLFGLLLLTVVVSTRRYFAYLGSERSYLTFLTAALMCLLLSPVLVNASLNAVRQGLASLLVFTALLSFCQHRWRDFVLFGVLATSFHYSSLLYLLFAPALLLSTRSLRIVAALAFLAYCSGLTMILVRIGAPAVYTTVMDYSANATFRAGVRVDFAVFSIFWYVLPYMVSRLVRTPFSERVKRSASIYLVLVLPFFLVGWGNYSNRYLLPAWLSASLIAAAILCYSRVSILRNPLLLRGGLVVASAVFTYYVTHMVIL